MKRYVGIVCVAALFSLAVPAAARAVEGDAIKVVFTKNAPPPVAPYNQATVAGRIVFLAGQLPIYCSDACWAAYDGKWAKSATLVTLAAKDGEFTPAITNATAASDPNVIAQTTVQTHQVMDNLKAVLAEVGLTFADVTKCNVYLVQPVNGTAFNTIYESYFTEAGAPPPARAAINITSLALGARIEVECLAVKAGR